MEMNSGEGIDCGQEGWFGWRGAGWVERDKRETTWACVIEKTIKETSDISM